MSCRVFTRTRRCQDSSFRNGLLVTCPLTALHFCCLGLHCLHQRCIRDCPHPFLGPPVSLPWMRQWLFLLWICQWLSHLCHAVDLLRPWHECDSDCPVSLLLWTSCVLAVDVTVTVLPPCCSGPPVSLPWMWQWLSCLLVARDPCVLAVDVTVTVLSSCCSGPHVSLPWMWQWLSCLLVALDLMFPWHGCDSDCPASLLLWTSCVLAVDVTVTVLSSCYSGPHVSLPWMWQWLSCLLVALDLMCPCRGCDSDCPASLLLWTSCVLAVDVTVTVLSPYCAGILCPWHGPSVSMSLMYQWLSSPWICQWLSLPCMCQWLPLPWMRQ